MDIVTPTPTPQPMMTDASGTMMDWMIPMSAIIIMVLIGIIVYVLIELFSEED